MSDIQALITEHLAIWTGADNEKKSGRGRASGSAASVYGVKKLRELILELAVRGKLVPQDASDEPASELLKRIEAEKAKLIKEGKIKAQKPLAEIGDDEKPFELPMGWEWVRLGNTGKIFNGNSINENEKLEKYTNLTVGFPFIATKDVGYGRGELDYKNGVLIPFDNETLKIAHKNAVLICSEGGSAGKKIGITNMDICFGNKLYANEVWAGIVALFIFYVYQSPIFFQSFSQRMTGIIGGISINEFINIPIPIPSEAEQHRIVAKVDELMTLCDQLENQHSNAIVAHEKLVSYLLNTLTQSQDAAQFNESWQRISANFDTLFTTESSINALKQTVLQLAVMGKLVPQDANDESIDVLWARIKNHETERIKNKEIQKPKNIEENCKPDIKIPSSWKFYLLNDLAFVTKLAGFEYTEYMALADFGEVPVIRAQNVRPFKPELSNLKYIDLKTSLQLQRCSLDRPALLMTFIGAGIGDVCAFYPERRWHLAPNVAKIEPFADTSLDYLVLYLNSSDGKRELFKSMKSTAQPSLSMTTIREIWISLPPLAEQLRIVAKVNELMAICDALKSALQKTQAIEVALANTLTSSVTRSRIVVNSNIKSLESEMNITTPLEVIPTAVLGSNALLAMIINSEGSKLDAKQVWRKSQLDLPSFYKQLKMEIEAGYIVKPEPASLL